MQKSSRNRKPSKRAGRAKAARMAKMVKAARHSARPPTRERANKPTKLLDLLRRPNWCDHCHALKRLRLAAAFRARVFGRRGPQEARA